MAKIIQGIGMSHSPMMAMEGKYWHEFAKNDVRHPLLYDEKGNHVTYEELRKQRNDKYAEEAQIEKMKQLYEEMNKGFSRLKDEFLKAKPDIVVVISNDHPGEFIDSANVPALAVFYGDEVVSIDERKRLKTIKRERPAKDKPEVFENMAKEMGMDKENVWPGSSKVGLHLIESLMKQGFDIGALKEASDPSKHGHGHGYGMVVTKLMDENQLIPMVPIYLNTWPPNVISPSRCYDIGLALRKAIEDLPDDLRIAVVASGGLSHFVTDVGLDELVLNALRNRSEEELRNLPEYRLKAGNSEIRNWVILAAATEHLEMSWDKYVPVFRTPIGTGIGMTFALWTL